MITMTTRSSISVKPSSRCEPLPQLGHAVLLRVVDKHALCYRASAASSAPPIWVNSHPVLGLGPGAERRDLRPRPPERVLRAPVGRRHTCAHDICGSASSRSAGTRRGASRATARRSRSWRSAARAATSWSRRISPLRRPVPGLTASRRSRPQRRSSGDLIASFAYLGCDVAAAYSFASSRRPSDGADAGELFDRRDAGGDLADAVLPHRPHALARRRRARSPRAAPSRPRAARGARSS